ncbi:EI24 domain-containing protein [Variovorax sp. HJSM1_2]|uniref:EI24 domain-containing protein n=1 Tax=Variovorax sp. HJSM1_2 TaxID=3366263 RepID=UPI003BC29E33
MRLFLDSFWRAAGYCLHPRVIALSLLPLVFMVALSTALGYFFWDMSLDQVRSLLDSAEWTTKLWAWLEGMGLGALKVSLAPLIVIFTVTPLIVIFSVLVVSIMMAPAMVRLVAERRFPLLEKKRGGTFLGSVWWSLSSTLIALVALIVSVPLWLVPPLILILPPLIWGWLTYRVMTYDVLAEHASRPERLALLKRHTGALLLMGVISGYLGAAPSLLWVSGALFAAAFVILAPMAIWIYTLVFAFSALWYAHYVLAALQAMRLQDPARSVNLNNTSNDSIGGLPPLSHANGLSDPQNN